MARWLLFIPLILFIVLGIFLWKGLSIDPTELPSALINKPFPEFKIASLKQSDKMLTKADFIGKPVLINIWATWCPACKQEHQQLVKMAGENKIAIIGLNYKDDRVSAISWLQQLGDPYQFTIYDADGMLGLDLGVYGAPETYLLDKNGIIKHRHVGVVTEEIWQQLQGMMNE
ncbi:MAG: DsbE family thiol:disulfide interchange protein [Methylococcaceae bacterium]|nr:DsbE family thiol:disulfide interchange protein [Methylococcaceae bacterium]